MGRFTRRFSVRVCGALAAFAVTKGAYSKYDTSPSRVTFLTPLDRARSARRVAMERLKEAQDKDVVWDVVVVGGGAVGLYTALDASLRGLSVVLLEAEDFGSGTTGSGARVLPGGFHAAQQALRQKDWSKVTECLTTWQDLRTWSNVAPALCRTDVRTLIPVIHSTELLEVRAATYLSSLLSVFVGPLRRGRMIGPGDVALTSFLKPDERPPCGGAVVCDGYLNPTEACVALARSAQAAGAVVVNHAPCTKIEPLQLHEHADETHRAARVLVHGRDGLTGDPLALRSRCVVNCAGAWADSVRSHDQLVQPSNVYSRCQSSLRLVIPKASLPLPAGINGVVVSSSLKTFSSVSVLPWDDDFLSVGISNIPVTGVAVKTGPEPFPLLVSPDFFASQAGRIIASLRTLGIDLKATDIVSAVNSVLPVMQPPSSFAGTANVVFDGYCLESHPAVGRAVPPLPGNSGRLPMLNILGGSIACSRRIAERAVDTVLLMLERPAVACQTRYTGLVGCVAAPTSDEHVDELDHERLVRTLVDEKFAASVTDVLARRSAGSFEDPAGATRGVRALAECLGRVLGWSPETVRQETQRGLGFLASITVDAKRAIVEANNST